MGARRAIYEQTANPNTPRSIRWRQSSGIEIDPVTREFVSSTEQGIRKLVELAEFCGATPVYTACDDAEQPGPAAAPPPPAAQQGRYAMRPGVFGQHRVLEGEGEVGQEEVEREDEIP